MRKKIINRELSWLSFNERVLQEAEDSSAPLLERLKFLGIFSNNQDEFFRVRVATIRRMVMLEKAAKKDLGVKPSDLLLQIQDRVRELQKRFDEAYFRILRELKDNDIFIVNEHELSKKQGEFVETYFHDKVRLETFPIMIDDLSEFPTLHDASIYLAVRFYKSQSPDTTQVHSLLEVPTEKLPRFVVLPKEDDRTFIIFLDDIIRYNLSTIYQIFDFDFIEAYTIKFTRDAELDIDNDVSKSFLTAVETSLRRRKSADPLRFIYDEEMPDKFLHFLMDKMGLSKSESVQPGVRYHNFKDFMGFPKLHKKSFWNAPLEQVPHPYFHKCHSLLGKMKERDVLLYYPYHSFDYFLDLLSEAAIDPKVSHIRINIYRVANDSNVIKSLITAVRNGKNVTVLVELRARFDEEANIYWVNKLRDEGVRVITGVNGLKVHSKLCLITRREKGEKIYYGTIGTGNFHEGTSKLYTDHQLFTSNQVITREVRSIFSFYEKNYELPKLTRLLCAPFTLRSKIISMINREIRIAKSGKKAELFFKMNSLVDTVMIDKLYQASRAGVKVRLIVRGICSIIPGVRNLSENIKGISIIDKFLEHSRAFIFHNGGKPDIYIGSADLMARNLDFRVEVLTPILDKNARKQLIDVMEIQWSGNVKARVFDPEQSNKYKPGKGKQIHSQEEILDYYKSFYKSESKNKSKV
ncbi:MAG: polyphosphate kinase 1 [Bacteroidetes bacterium]|nr:polyphosphate kinase 1 [Bacteroidota bacterium]